MPFWNFPAPHAWHVVEHGDAANVPGLHATSPVRLALLVWPADEQLQLCAPGIFAYFPAPQAVHSLEHLELAYDPAAHSTSDVLPAFGVWPAATHRHVLPPVVL